MSLFDTIITTTTTIYFLLCLFYKVLFTAANNFCIFRVFQYFFTFFGLQKLNDRSPFSEEVVISSSLKKDKKGVMQSTKLVLGISNWHFNRDTQHLNEGPRCKLEDINLSFKLSSTAFNADEAGASTSATTSKEQQLKYDRNGVTVPYAAFCSLMEQPLFFDYINSIKEQYEKFEGALNKSNLESDDTDNTRKENEVEEEEENLGKKRQKKGKTLTDSEDDEVDGADEVSLVEESLQQQHQKQHQSLLKNSTRRGSKKAQTTPAPPSLQSSSTPST